MQPGNATDRVGRRARRRSQEAKTFAALCLLAGAVASVAGCGSATSSGRPGGSTTGPVANPAAATATADASITWQTVAEVTGSSTSQGGGTNSDSSTSSTSVGGAYRVVAACQGTGSLQITLDPGGSIALPCTQTQQAPVRIAGGDSAPSGGTLSVTVDRQGDVESSDVKVQVKE